MNNENGVSNEKKKKNEWPAAIGCGTIVLIVILIFFYKMMNPSSTSHEAGRVSSSVVSSGDSAKITKDVFAAKTQDDYDTMFNFINAGNTAALDKMVSQGKIVVLPAGTKVDVIDRQMFSLKVDFSSGSGWVPSEFVSK